MTDLQVLLSGANNSSFRWEKNGRVIEGENTATLSKGHFSKGDRITVAANTGNREVSVSVQVGNTPPVVKEVTITPQYIFRGVDITASPGGYDADGDHVRFSYSWHVNGRETGEHTALLKGDQFKKGEKIVLTVIPSDTEGDGEHYTSVPLVIPNAPPRFTSAPVEGLRGGVYEYNAHAEDPDGDRVRYSIAAGPGGMTIDEESGKVTWQVSQGQGGDHVVEIQAQDEASLKVIQKYTLTITIPGD